MQHESNAAAAASPEKNEGPCAEANDGGRGVLGLSRLENTRKQRQRLEQGRYYRRSGRAKTDCAKYAGVQATRILGSKQLAECAPISS